MQLRDAVLRAPGAQGPPEALNFAVVRLPARLAQLDHEVAQGAPEQHQPLAVQWHPLERSTALDQQHPAMAASVAGPEALFQQRQNGMALIELIAQHQDANGHRGVSAVVWGKATDQCSAEPGTDRGSMGSCPTSATPLGRQPAGPARHSAGITPLHQPLLRAEGTVAAIHHEALAVSLLVVHPQP